MDHVPRGMDNAPGMTNKLPCKSIQRNASLDAFADTAPRLDRHPLARYRRRRPLALDRGAAAGGNRAARPAFACRHRRHDRRGLSGAGARTSASHYACHLPAVAADRDFHRAYRLSWHADAADRGRAQGLDGARRKRCARRRQKARDGDEPWRQQRGDDAGRAGFACSRFGAPDGLFSAEELRHGIHGGAVETSIMLARYPDTVRKDALADFRPNSIAMEQEFRWLSAHRPAPFAWQAQDLHTSGAAGDATKASAEMGEKLLDHGARAFCELLAEVDKFDVKRLAAGPNSSSK